ncbi:transposase [Rhizobium mesoamericanum]|uniref:transposase n=1 Tax=Rhizobium mesoamericanum TaxID=1079800 RepID=UPI003521C08C
MEPGASVSAIAHRLGIHPSQLFSWRRDARDGQRRLSRDPAIEVDKGRLAQLRWWLATLLSVPVATSMWPICSG